jgi:hypothetical protein
MPDCRRTGAQSPASGSSSIINSSAPNGAEMRILGLLETVSTQRGDPRTIELPD